MPAKRKSITEQEPTDLDAVNDEIDAFVENDAAPLPATNHAACADCGAPEYAHGKYTDHLGNDTQTHAYRVGVWNPPNGGPAIHNHGLTLASTFRGFTAECPYCLHQKLAERETLDLNKRTGEDESEGSDEQA